MIIGNGLIATAFKSLFGDDENIILFAAGVSNSSETRKEEFQREQKMLMECINSRKSIIYFSTCSVKDPVLFDAPYVVHKLKMEVLVRTAFNYTIFRLPQVVGKTSNPNTLTNYLFNKIKSGTNFQVWRYAQRNLIDIDDVAKLVNYMVRASLANSDTINIASPNSISVLELVNIFELVLNRKGNYKIIDAGGTYFIDSELTVNTSIHAGVYFDSDYIEKTVRKYYGK